MLAACCSQEFQTNRCLVSNLLSAGSTGHVGRTERSPIEYICGDGKVRSLRAVVESHTAFSPFKGRPVAANLISGLLFQLMSPGL